MSDIRGVSITPMVLPDYIVKQLRLSSYVCLATLSAWTWDLVLNLDEELVIIRGRRLSLPYVVYSVSRIFSLLYVIFSAAIDGDAKFIQCNSAMISIAAIGAIAVPANSLLMYFRIRAVYNHSILVKTFFGISWLAVLGACVTAPFSVQGTRVAGRCIITTVKMYGAAGILAAAVNDTLIFLAISYQLLTSHATGDRWQDRMKGFFRGAGLHDMQRLLLQTGQIYYMATAGMNILAVIDVMLPSFPPIIRGIFTTPNVALTNNMTCRVFRQIRLDLINDDRASADSALESEVVFRRVTTIELLPRNRSQRSSRRDNSVRPHRYNEVDHNEVFMNISREVSA